MQVGLEKIKFDEVNIKKIIKRRLVLIPVHVILAVLVALFTLLLHHIEEVHYRSIFYLHEGEVVVFGVHIQGAVIHEVVLWFLFAFQVAVIVLICLQRRKSFRVKCVYIIAPIIVGVLIGLLKVINNAYGDFESIAYNYTTAAQGNFLYDLILNSSLILQVIVVIPMILIMHLISLIKLFVEPPKPVY